jgi:hypothetical protein
MTMTQTQNRRILNWTHNIQGDLRVIMSPTELKMQPTIHLEGKTGNLPRPYPALRSKCIVGCIFNSVGLIITRESPCTLFLIYLYLIFNTRTC